MKLLFDQNLSFKLADRLSDLFPASQHVRDAGMASADDADVWTYAREKGFVIVSKDSDFHLRALVEGQPPKVVWIRRGNCSTADIEQILRAHVEELRSFEIDADATVLILL